MKQYINPYKDSYPPHGDADITKAQARIPTTELHRIKAIHLRNGAIETTLCLFWSKLVKELNARNITNFTDVERFEHFVANFELVLPSECGRGTPGVPNAEAMSSNVGRGTDSQGIRMAHEKGLSPDPESIHAKGGRRGRGSVGGQKGKTAE